MSFVSIVLLLLLGSFYCLAHGRHSRYQLDNDSDNEENFDQVIDPNQLGNEDFEDFLETIEADLSQGFTDSATESTSTDTNDLSNTTDSSTLMTDVPIILGQPTASTPVFDDTTTGPYEPEPEANGTLTPSGMEPGDTNNATEIPYTGATGLRGINIIKKFEKFHPKFYRNSNGVKAIGFGHTCPKRNSCQEILPPIDRDQAHELLMGDLKVFESCVKQLVRYGELRESQFSALVSFTYDIGCKALGRSKLLKNLNAGKLKAASSEFGKFTKKRGRVLRLLVRRRKAEEKLFCLNGCEDEA